MIGGGVITNSIEWWTTTTAPRDLFKPPRYRSAERDSYLRETFGVDPAILAGDIGLPPRTVLSYQRRLGLRQCAPSRRRA